MHSPLERSLSPLSLLLFLWISSSTTTTTFRPAKAFNVTTLTFGESYSPLFSKFNIRRSPDDKTVSLLLNRLSGSGIISSDYYNYGFFSASIKMPSGYTAGIVVAFYTSNVDTFERNHDELDIEFLGNVPGKAWRFQTNLYGNGSVSRGREERFYVDEIPIREVVRNAAMRGDYPSKPMSVYATIWDASSWATNGGKRKVNYKYQPFIAEFKDLVLEGCIVDPVDQLLSSNCTDTAAALMSKDYSTVTPERRKSMRWFRQRHMYYSYCYDTIRYPVPPPECVISPSERQMFTSIGRPKSKTRSGGTQRRRPGGRSAKRRSKAAVDASRHQAAM
ncbi:UNVERIFIED_CONTAM: putative xyloglucan endotransglucosylase/hydrolase protein 30 [Sesamum latifolium]|uniref:Xyloglucan endotransglucosylase/hydrolase n=1 Tax=Sesamum latifolium TaxID=2727402 RepID=A0AAW2WYF7_9LAMI